MRTLKPKGFCQKCKARLEEGNSIRKLKTWCRTCHNEKRRRKVKPEDSHRRYAKIRDALREEAVAVYGGVCWECRRQKKSKFLFLDRHGVVPPKTGVYKQLKNEGWPEGPQVVCGDCFLARRWKT